MGGGTGPGGGHLSREEQTERSSLRRVIKRLLCAPRTVAGALRDIREAKDQFIV